MTTARAEKRRPSRVSTPATADPSKTSFTFEVKTENVDTANEIGTEWFTLRGAPAGTQEHDLFEGL